MNNAVAGFSKLSREKLIGLPKNTSPTETIKLLKTIGIRMKIKNYNRFIENNQLLHSLLAFKFPD
jgi:hypothetical protein